MKSLIGNSSKKFTLILKLFSSISLTFKRIYKELFMPPLSELAKIVHHFNAILLDAYGVFWNGNAQGLIPGAKETMAALVKQEKTIGILSNSTQLSHNEKIKFEKHGLIEGLHYHFIVTSGQMVRKLILSENLPFPIRNKKYILSGPVHPYFSPPQHLFAKSSFSETNDYNNADFIYIHTPHIHGKDQTDPSAFKKMCHDMVAAKLPIFCSNPDGYAHEGSPPQLVVRQGTIARMCEEIGGKVYYIGKPYPDVFEMALEELQRLGIYQKDSVLMLGDTSETDIRGANNIGLASALIIETGISAERIAKFGKPYLNGLSKEDTPNYFINRLGEKLVSAPS